MLYQEAQKKKQMQLWNKPLWYCILFMKSRFLFYHLFILINCFQQKGWTVRLTQEEAHYVLIYEIITLYIVVTAQVQ